MDMIYCNYLVLKHQLARSIGKLLDLPSEGTIQFWPFLATDILLKEYKTNLTEADNRACWMVEL